MNNVRVDDLTAKRAVWRKENGIYPQWHHQWRPVLPQYCRASSSAGNYHPLYPQHRQSVAAGKVPDLPHRPADSQRPLQVIEL